MKLPSKIHFKIIFHQFPLKAKLPIIPMNRNDIVNELLLFAYCIFPYINPFSFPLILPLCALKEKIPSNIPGVGSVNTTTS